MSISRAALALMALGAPLFIGLTTGCEAEVDEPDYLGPYTASTVLPPAAPANPARGADCPTVAPLAGVDLAAPTQQDNPASAPARPCAATVTVTAGVTTDLTASDAAYLVSVGTGVERLARLPDGCPGAGEPLGGIAVGEGEALAGPLAQGDELWVARADRVDVHDAQGEALASCALGARPRALAASGERGWAAVGSGVTPLTRSGDTCAVGEPWSVGGVALALAARADGGLWVATARVGCGTPVALERRDDQGRLVDAQGRRVDAQGRPLDEAGQPIDGAAAEAPLTAASLGLCTVSAVVEQGGSLWVGDRACGRVVRVGADRAVKAHWEAPAGVTVLGLAARTTDVLVLTGAAGAAGEQGFTFLPGT